MPQEWSATWQSPTEVESQLPTGVAKLINAT